MAVKEALDLYGLLAGKRINKQKSSIIFSTNTPHTFKRFLSSTIGVPYKPNLGKYLGVYVDSPSHKTNFSEMVDKLNRKLSGWKARLLSQAGRLVLVKSVLTSLPLYRMSSFTFLKKILSQMDSIITNFFWGYKGNKPAIHLLMKNYLQIPKRDGGLGIKSFSLMNQALLAKQFWRITQHQTSLFSRWTISKYFKGSIESLPKASSQPSVAWKGLSASMDLIRSHLWWKINSGNQVSLNSPFWWNADSQPADQVNTANLLKNVESAN